MTTAPNPPIVLYHYERSPYARRVRWYLWLRNIPFSECIQPPVLPRPDLTQELGVRYRRIPVLAIGRDVYLDSRLILRKLEALFPPSDAHPALSTTEGSHRALERLLSQHMTGIFFNAAQLMPPAIMTDPAFVADRRELITGKAAGPGEEGGSAAFSKESMAAARPESLASIRGTMELLETTLLADERDWVLKTDEVAGPTLVDIEAVWVIHWLHGMAALQEGLLGPGQFPKVHAYVARFNDAVVAAAKKQADGSAVVNGQEAARMLLGSGYAEPESSSAVVVDQDDPVLVAAGGLGKGDTVQLFPSDYGSAHREIGKLVIATKDEYAVEIKAPTGQNLRVHAPRTGFRVDRDKGSAVGPSL